MLAILLPLLAAVTYVAAALLLKRASALGADSFGSVRLCNFATAVTFAPLWLLGGTLPPISQWWQPAVVSLVFIGGQVFTMLALRVGDVSVTTPVLGVKIMLVAIFTTAISHESLSPALWAASALSTLAVILLNASRPKSAHRIGATIALAITAAACYALFDVLVQYWSPAWGMGRFLPVMVGMAAVLTFFLPGRNMPGPHRKWALGGAVCLSLQAVFLVSSIAYFRHATTANVLYSSRGLWSVLIVWLVAGRYDWAESQHTNRVMLWRLAGAVLMIAAIALGVSLR